MSKYALRLAYSFLFTLIRRTQPVEILYAAWPMFMVIDPSLGGPLLEPLLSAQDTAAYTLPYAMSDLGAFALSLFRMHNSC